ncbi:MAG: polysaccharide biosynthesis C-terminal domain-containing protein [Bacteroidota bacterium]
MIKIQPNHINSLQFFHLLRYAANILISVLLAKSYLSTKEIGIYESFLFYFSIFTFFWLTGLIQGILSINKKEGDQKYLRILIFNGFILSLVFSLLTVLLSLLFLPDLFSTETSELTMLFVVYLILTPSTWLIEYIILLNKQYRKLILYGLLNFILQIIMVGMIPIIGLPLFWIFYGMLVVTIIKWFILSYMLYNRFSESISLKISKQILKTSWPLIITAILTSSAVFIDGLLINLKFDESQFAIFRYGAKEFPIFILMATSFSNSLLMRFSGTKEINPVLHEIKHESGKMIKTLFPVSIILLLISQHLYPLVFNPDFLESYRIFDIYLLLVVSRFVFPQTIFIGLQKTDFVLKAGFLELVINIISSIILIQYFGIIGVAYGTIIAFYFEKILLIYYAKNKLQIEPSKYINVKILFFFSTLLWLIFILKNLII